jgi:CRISPR/Cas system-associated exonuclease Cas4 (RecB family)
LESPSSILAFMQCSRKYYYRYVRGLEAERSIHLIVGSVVHASIEAFHNIKVERIPSQGFYDTLHFGITQLFDTKWDQMADELQKLGLTDQEIAFHRGEARLMLNNFCQYHTAKMMAEQYRHNISPWEAFTRLRPNSETKIKSEKLGVMGVIDAVHEGDGETVIIDYKTSKKDSIDRDCLIQLAIYALLYKELTGRPPDRVGIHFLRHGEKILKVSPGLLALGEEKCTEIRSLNRSDKQEDYPMKKSGLCKYKTGQCDYYETCKPWNSIEFS